MSKTEQRKFVIGLSNRIRDDIVSQINNGKILQEWDGHELRTLLAMRHQWSADMSNTAMKGKRGRIFRNHCLVANL